MLQEFGITCACGAVYTEHWKQLLKEFGAACVCGAVYTQHWRQLLKEFVAIPVCSTDGALGGCPISTIRHGMQGECMASRSVCTINKLVPL